jgi:peptidoglycan/xylan/chitin deacetylase (PgdA/CDA1 family)
LNAKTFLLAAACGYLSMSAAVASAPKKAATPQKASAALLPSSFYNAPSFSPNQRPYEMLLAKNQYARDQHYTFNKIMRGDTHKPQIALTFDDGPHPVYTLQLLDILRRFHTSATFFVVGEQVEKNPGLVRLEVAEGSEVGDHTYDHVNLTLIPPELVAYEVNKCDAAITQATGAPVRFFRPPGGEYNGEVLREVSRHGFITTLWTNDPGDFTKPSSAVIVKRTLAHLENGSIILLHDGIPETLEALPAIITAARHRGYRFVTLSQLANPR